MANSAPISQPLNLRLRRQRLSRGISAAEASQRVGCSRAHLSTFETGTRDRCNFSPHFIRDLAEVVGARVSMADLFEPHIAPLPSAEKWARAEAAKR